MDCQILSRELFGAVSSLTNLFNGSGKGREDPGIAHPYTTAPVSTTLIVPIRIERIHKGVYGYRPMAHPAVPGATLINAMDLIAMRALCARVKKAAG
jgi:hypothetical protein